MEFNFGVAMLILAMNTLYFLGGMMFSERLEQKRKEKEEAERE